MSYRSDVALVMDNDTLAKFDELKKEHDFYNYKVQKKFKYQDLDLTCIRFNAVKWYDTTDQFLLDWYDYIHDNQDKVKYYEIMRFGEDMEDNEQYCTGTESHLGYFLYLDRDIKLYNE